MYTKNTDEIKEKIKQALFAAISATDSRDSHNIKDAQDKKTAAAEISANSKTINIVVGISGGCDSVCLLHTLQRISDDVKDQIKINLIPVHINHGLRGADADRDAEFVQNFCKKLNLDLKFFEFDCKSMSEKLGISIEEAGRIKRYEIFKQLISAPCSDPYSATDSSPSPTPDLSSALNSAPDCNSDDFFKKNSLNLIAVGHNEDDQAETVLMRILRGTGVDGLAAMKIKNDSIIRPMLGITRREIEKYCEDNDLEFRTDVSNLESIYHRNFIRLELIPFIEKNLNPNVKSALARLAELARIDSDFLWKEAEKYYNDSIIDDSVPSHPAFPAAVKLWRKKVEPLHESVKSRIIIRALAEVGLAADISSAHINTALNLISFGKSGAICEFPDFYQMRTTRDELIFLRITPAEAEARQRVEAAKYSMRIEELKSQYDTLELKVRTRKPGDFIIVNGMHKSIKKYFNELKIDSEKRDFIPLLCRDNEVLKIFLD